MRPHVYTRASPTRTHQRARHSRWTSRAVACVQVYPRARWPTGAQIRGYGAWGGVVAAAALFVIQVRGKCEVTCVRACVCVCVRVFVSCCASRARHTPTLTPPWPCIPLRCCVLHRSPGTGCRPHLAAQRVRRRHTDKVQWMQCAGGTDAAGATAAWTAVRLGARSRRMTREQQLLAGVGAAEVLHQQRQRHGLRATCGSVQG
jgi:hypothetical protein